MTKHSKPQKYRPVLTARQITFLTELCRNSHTSEAKSCIASLAMYEYKISMGVVTSLPQSENPRVELAESLGFEKAEVPEIYSTDAKGLYLLYIDSGKKNMNLAQMEILDDYRYMNDFMTQEEEIEYENSLLVNVKKT